MAKEWVISEEDLGCDGAYLSHKEIIRCRDCKHRYKMACHKAEFYECSHIGLASETGHITHVGVDDDFFCADGERRTE